MSELKCLKCGGTTFKKLIADVREHIYDAKEDFAYDFGTEVIIKAEWQCYQKSCCELVPKEMRQILNDKFDTCFEESEED